MRKLIHEEPNKGKQKGKLYDNFQSWIRVQYGTEPTVVPHSYVWPRQTRPAYG